MVCCGVVCARVQGGCITLRGVIFQGMSLELRYSDSHSCNLPGEPVRITAILAQEPFLVRATHCSHVCRGFCLQCSPHGSSWMDANQGPGGLDPAHPGSPSSSSAVAQCTPGDSEAQSVSRFGISALDLWDLVVEVLHSSSNQPKNSQGKMQGNLLHDTPSRKHTTSQTMIQMQYNDLNLVRCSQNFEDNDAVIKMIIKGRSPTMRHVSRTHKVALD